jgi:hypothetical protein
MNIDAFKRTRDLIAKQPPEAFDMTYFDMRVDHPCGTTFCIAGWACAAHGVTYDLQEEIWEDAAGKTVDVEVTAREILALTEAEADHVFFGDWSDELLTTITQAEALEYLDKVIEKGSVYV